MSFQIFILTDILDFMTITLNFVKGFLRIQPITSQ